MAHIEDRSLAHIARFSSRPQHFPESVADHSFFVTYITSVLCELLRMRGEKVDSEKAITMALLHDMEERFSGDILSPFKHHSKEVNSAIRVVNRKLISGVFEGLPKHIEKQYTALWNEEGRQKSVEAQVVKMADRLSLLAKCKEEMDAGNSFFTEIYKREHKKVIENKQRWFKIIRADVLGEDDDARQENV